MTISATIVTVSVYKHSIHLVLEPGSPLGKELLIIPWTPGTLRVPLVGQRITGDKGHCIVEGGGGERIVHARQGSFLREQVE